MEMEREGEERKALDIASLAKIPAGANANYTVSPKTEPLRLIASISHYFVNSQHLLIIFGRERPYSILN